METELKFKVGDRVMVKSLEWYNDEPKSIYGDICFNGLSFVEDMKKYCGKILTIIKIVEDCYIVEGSRFCWQDWMLKDEVITEDKQEVEQLNQNNMETKKMTLQEAQEFVKNTKYIVWSEDESRQLQEKLFEIGCEWMTGGKNLYNTKAPFLFVNHNLLITFAEKYEYERFDDDSFQINLIENVVSIEIEDKEEPKPKFNPNTLQPFDKVLIRQNEKSIWIARFFEFYEICSCGSYHTTSGSTWKYCIPFNDDTKHLHRTCDEAPEFYQLD